MVRVRLHEDDAGVAHAYARSVSAGQADIEGYQGYGVWQSAQDPLARLILFSYASEDAAQRGLAAVADRRTLIERQDHPQPADVVGLHVAHAEGAFSRALPQSATLSISIRIAEPGRGADLVDQYLRTFGELAAIPGFAGMLIGVSQNLAEEVVGFVAWDDEGAFRASLPQQTVYQVKLYERSFE